MKFFKCDICGKILTLIHETETETICCGQKMRELIPGMSDGAIEKHVPVYTVNENTLTVQVGSVPHPMTEAHFIEWIAIETDTGFQLKKLTPTDKPERVFALGPSDQVRNVYAYCNLHGLWKS